jgi:hypothetical protein
VSRTVYVLSRRAVLGEGRSAGLCQEPNRASGLSWVPLHLFADRDRAEACRAELERAARLRLCPFALNPDIRCLTRLDGDTLQERLFDLGLLPPLGGWYVDFDWVGWWNEVAPGLTEEQVLGVWGLLDGARLYDVAALRVED